jgi:hypothetical protein
MRVHTAGGTIYYAQKEKPNGELVNGPLRIKPGRLSVSRTFGDF